MLDILTTQTSPQQTGKSAQNGKVENAGSKDQAFSEEYAATADDAEEAETQQTEESQAAAEERQSKTESDAETGDEMSSEKSLIAKTENSEQNTEEPPAFAIADSGTTGKVPESGATPSSVELSEAKRGKAQDLIQAAPAEAAKAISNAGATKAPAATTSAAEVFLTAKAAENAALPASTGLAGKPEKGAVAEPLSPSVPTVKPENTPAALPSNPISSDQFAEKLKSVKLSEELRARAIPPRSDAPVPPVAAAALNTPQATKTVPMTALAKVEAGKEKTVLDATSALNIEALTATEARSTSSTATTPLNQLLGRAETPAAIARQMAEALQKLPDRPVEISLNPKELGRVRMNISAVEAGITVTIVTERPETLDLMRRNIDQLVREFQAIGYSDINFAFSEGETHQGFGEDFDERNGVSPTQLELLEAEEIAASDETNLAAQTGVDIRL